jgi:hypothetical protein
MAAAHGTSWDLQELLETRLTVNPELYPSASFSFDRRDGGERMNDSKKNSKVRYSDDCW